MSELKYDPLLTFLWKNNGGLKDFDEAIRKINLSALKLKLMKSKLLEVTS